MIKNYLKVAFRNLSRNKIYGLINIVGLATGMTVALLIGLWVWDELSFDHYHKNHNRLAEIVSNTTFNGITTSGMDAAVPLANELRQRFLDDFNELALTAGGSHSLAVGEKKTEQDGLWAEAGFPKMFTFKMLQGSQEALKDPESAMISQSLAKELFGAEDPMGKTIRIDNTTDMTVAGVYEEIPQHSRFYGTEFLLAGETTGTRVRAAMVGPIITTSYLSNCPIRLFLVSLVPNRVSDKVVLIKGGSIGSLQN